MKLWIMEQHNFFTFLRHIWISYVFREYAAISLQDTDYLGIDVDISSSCTNTSSKIDLERHDGYQATWFCTCVVGVPKSFTKGQRLNISFPLWPPNHVVFGSPFLSISSPRQDLCHYYVQMFATPKATSGRPSLGGQSLLNASITGRMSVQTTPRSTPTATKRWEGAWHYCPIYTAYSVLYNHPLLLCLFN